MDANLLRHGSSTNNINWCVLRQFTELLHGDVLMVTTPRLERVACTIGALLSPIN